MSMFLELPEVVVRALLKCLDFQEKLTLRLVCTTSHGWVTDKNFAKNVKVPLSCTEDLEHWISKHEESSHQESASFCGWCSFILLQNLRAYDESKMSQFLQRFQRQIEKLELRQWKADTFKFWKLLSSLHIKLKSLTIQDLVVTNARVTLPMYLLDIRRLSIQQVSFNEASELKNWEGIIKAFGGDVDYITIPRLHYTGTQMDISWPHIKSLQFAMIVQPILNMLEDEGKKMRAEYEKTKKITLDVEHLFPIHFGRVAERCATLSEMGAADVYFLNVNDKQVKYVFLMSGDGHENDFLARILSIKEKIDDRRPLQMWKNVEEMDIRTSRCDVRNLYGEQRQGMFPKLKTLKITFDSFSKEDPSFAALNRVTDLLLNVQRKSLETLVLKWPDHGHNTPKIVVNLEEIKSNFCSLKKLVVVADGAINFIK